MKKYIAFFLLLPAAFTSRAQQPLLYSTKPLTASVAQVDAETSGGSITIEGGHDKDARLEIYVQRNNGRQDLTRDEAQKLLEDNYNLDIEDKGRTLEASARRKSSVGNGHNSLSISFKIFVPTDVSSLLHTSGGSIRITQVSGTQNFSTAGGGLKIDQVNGNVDGETAGGGIVLSSSKGNINLQTAGGGLAADHCEGKIHLKTAGGGVKAENIKGELYAHTAGGNIRLDDLSCSLDAATSGGNIAVTISDPGRYVKLNTSGGNVSLQLPGEKGMDLQLSGSHVSADDLKSFHGEIKKDKIKGALNGGGIPVEVSGTGDVRVTFQ